MGIISNELKLYASQTVNNTTTNGGRLSANQLTSNTNNNIFPELSSVELAAGLTRYRKVHFKIADSENTIASSVKLFLSTITSSAFSRLTFWNGTQRDTQADITGSERKYGVGTLNADVTTSDNTIVVDFETGSAADTVVQSADTILISDGVNSGYYTVATGGVTWAGEQATIVLTTTLANNFDATTPQTTVASVLTKTDVKTTQSNWVETSTSGTYNDGTYPLELENLSTIEQTWTLIFTSSSAFGVVGDTVGSVSTGTTAGDFAPTNSDFSLPYFTLLSAGFGGTWASGDTIVFQTHPASVPIWLKYVVSAGASATTDTATLSASVSS